MSEANVTKVVNRDPFAGWGCGIAIVLALALLGIGSKLDAIQKDVERIRQRVESAPKTQPSRP